MKTEYIPRSSYKESNVNSDNFRFIFFAGFFPVAVFQAFRVCLHSLLQNTPTWYWKTGDDPVTFC